MKKLETKKIETKKKETKKIETKKIETKKIETKKIETKKIDIKTNNEKKVKKNIIMLHKTNHEEYINMLYLNKEFHEKKSIKTHLKSKLNGYKNQDIKKKRYDKDKNISYDELIEKLVISKLLCYYCRCKCLLISNEKRDSLQWTLDRINNDIGHFNDNVVICCLNCNLQKRRRNDEHFKFLKQMKIIKHY